MYVHGFVVRQKKNENSTKKNQKSGHDPYGKHGVQWN